MVKFIKLDRRHNLYHKGYRYAFLIDRWSDDSNRIEKAIKELEGWRWDSTFWGKSKFNRTVGYIARPYYVGFKNESTATMAMLKL
jgi:hypothetical protein